eukprot:scaffold10201_cov119-Cylindrotheca_fusiformis.AAC.3
MKADAIRALSNYMLYQSAQKDGQMQNAMKQQMKNIRRDEDEDTKRRMYFCESPRNLPKQNDEKQLRATQYTKYIHTKP